MTYCGIRESMLAVICVSAFGLSAGQVLYISAGQCKIGDFIVIVYQNALTLGVFADDFVCLPSIVIRAADCVIVGKADPMAQACGTPPPPDLCRIN